MDIIIVHLSLLFIYSLCQGNESGIVLHSTDVSEGPAAAHRELLVSTLEAHSYPAHRPVVFDCIYGIVNSGLTTSPLTIEFDAVSNNLTRLEKRPPNVLRAPTDFVVKWFRNDELAPLYTWIPAIGQRLFHHAYRDMVDPLYKHNDSPLEMFRAVRIIRPVAALSGNFRCDIELTPTAQLNDTDGNRSDGDRGEGLLMSFNRTIYFYDQPGEFEIQLNFSTRRIRCIARTLERPISTVKMTLYKVNYNEFEMPVEKVVLISSNESHYNSYDNRTILKLIYVRKTTLAGESIIEVGAALQMAELKVDIDGWSRNFICELRYSRVQTAEPLTFHRSIRLIRETRNIETSAIQKEDLYEEDFRESGRFMISLSRGKRSCHRLQFVSTIIMTTHLYLLYITGTLALL